MHVVQESVVRAAQKANATLTTTVNSGLLWSVENPDHAVAIREGPGRGVGSLRCHLFAKVRVAGSNPVVRSKELPGQGFAGG